ncbi:MAG: hypothetical protein LBH43_10970 [Treponema sp.]|jgi:hypothetical protein|nr:hypothetical protein [Treponema sp.]
METNESDIVSAPDEMEYLQKISQMTDEAEIGKTEQEYLAQCKAYFDWLRENRSGKNK